MRLDEILPEREWVTLTEAATAIAFGKAMTAQEFAERQLAAHEASINEYMSAARDAHRAAKIAGWPDRWVDDLPNPEIIEYPQEISRFVERSPSNSYLQEEIQPYIQCVNLLVSISSAGRTEVAGVRGANSGYPEIIPAFAMNDLRCNSSVTFDALSTSYNSQAWSSVTVKRAGIADVEHGPRIETSIGDQKKNHAPHIPDNLEKSSGKNLGKFEFAVAPLQTRLGRSQKGND